MLSIGCLNLIIPWFFKDYLQKQQEDNLKGILYQVEEIVSAYGEGYLSFNELERSITVIDQSANVHICLFNMKNEIIFNSEGGTNSVSLVKQLEKIRNQLTGKEFFCSVIKDPKQPTLDIMLVAINTSTEDIFAVAFIPVADVNEWLTEILRLVWLSSAIVLLITGPILYWLSKHITRPLLDMEKLAKKMSEGDFDCQMETKRQDEIGSLAVTFNQMAMELERIEKYRQEFLANVSHELRTPLTSIRGFVQGLLDGNISPEKTEYYLLRVYSEAERLTYIVNDLLDLARLKAGQVELKREPLDLWTACREVAEGLHLAASQRNISLTCHFSSDKAMIAGDYYRIIQVLVNLLDNAIKFTKPDGQVVISGELADKEWLIHIKDQGSGIAPEDLAKIFDRFYRGTVTGIGGTGLGLAISRLLIEAHGGRITVKRASDTGGSIFTIYLPALQIIYN